MRTKTFVVYILHTVFKINVCTIKKNGKELRLMLIKKKLTYLQGRFLNEIKNKK